jgi:hypothetical protein
MSRTSGEYPAILSTSQPPWNPREYLGGHRELAKAFLEPGSALQEASAQNALTNEHRFFSALQTIE